MTTQTIDLTTQWTEVGSALALVVDTDYYVEALRGPVELRRTASADAPAGDDRGRPIWPGSDRREPDSRTYTPVAGEYLHARALRGDGAALVLDEES